MIKINLYDYREELKRSTIQKQVLTSASLVMGFAFLILFSWMYEKSRISRVDMEVKGLQQQVNALQSEVNQVKTMQAKQDRVGTILTGIENLRANQMPATKTLYDVNLSVPDDIWLTKVTQMSKEDLTKGRVPTILIDDSSAPGATNNNVNRNANTKPTATKDFIEIEGHALEDGAVARFVEQLEGIPYFKMVFLYKTEQTFIGKTKVRKFSIYCYMPANPNKTAA
jgi:Tfp pilus assembly protein PilN